VPHPGPAAVRPRGHRGAGQILADDPIVRLIARLFDINPSRVHVAPADPAEVRGLLGAG